VFRNWRKSVCKALRYAAVGCKGAHALTEKNVYGTLFVVSSFLINEVGYGIVYLDFEYGREEV
jgi:hypothetical protein